MRTDILDLSVNEITSNELSLGGLKSIDLSITELESAAAPDVASFLGGVSAATAVSALILT
ncbi:hypothetical protein DMH03_13515 [Amycolatopsis sp. WAC 01376]|uniref:hypothetical protein n=1 Tax=Amycolatopsis sp. WAC 01376 TaxID=2203195 RepID=UPI000F78A822|nr:hypothetical protein [Amycolatopsis sp. WAC 01376]RSM63051.1 hypothetical protein DMH03_13515 [Amycolatopsis sp. WAC 01376]